MISQNHTPIINLSAVNDHKLFFGESDRIIRVDKVTSTIAAKLKADSEGNTWFTREVEYDGDRIRFTDLPDEAKRIFQLNIGYQTIMDSGASNIYLDLLSQLCTDPTWIQVYRRIGIEETIHAESYSYALSQVLGHEASPFLDDVLADPVVQSRMTDEIDLANEMYTIRHALYTGQKAGRKEKESLMKLLIATYLLEGIKFPFSFFITFTINKSYSNAIQGLKRLIQLIAHDEMSLHIPTHLHVFKELRSNPHHEFVELFEDGWFDRTITEMTTKIVEDELAWNDYLLLKGPIPGYNKAIGQHLIKYFGNLRLIGAKVDPIYPDIESNDIIKWFNEVKDINKTQVAQQEASNGSYQKGGLVNNLGEDKWD